MPTLDRKTALSWLVDPLDIPSLANYRVYNLNWDINQVMSIANGNYVNAFQSDHNRSGGRFTKIDFTREIAGFTPASPTDKMAPEMRLLMACGFSKTWESPSAFVLTLGDPHFVTGEGGDLDPIGALTKIVDGKKWIATNCVGDATIKFAGLTVPSIDFKFKGNYSASVAVDSGPNLAFIAGETPVATSTGNLVVANGSSYNTLVCRSIELALNNEIPDRPDIGYAAVHGFAPFCIVGREPIYTMVVECPFDLTDFNPEEIFDNEEQLTVTFSHNPTGTDGQRIDIEFDAYINDEPVPSDDKGMLVYTLKLKQSIDTAATPLTLTWL